MIRTAFSLIALLIVGPCSALAQAHIPGLPPQGAVDYVATYVESFNIPNVVANTRVVYHHNGKTRVDSSSDRGTLSIYRDSRHGAVVMLSRDRQGQLTSLEVRRETPSSDRFSPAVRTGETDEVSGKSCDIWTSTLALDQRTLSQGTISTHHCLARDGVELRSTTFSPGGALLSSIEAKAIERRPVDAGEVTVPSEAFNVASWTGARDKSVDDKQHLPDFESVLSNSGAAGSHHEVVFRRHLPWSARITVMGPMRWTYISNQDSNTSFYLEQNLSGATEKLTIMQHVEGTSHSQEMGRTDTILGERCTWFNLYPGVSHPTLQCRTDDSIPLAETQIGYGVRQLQAVKLRRAPVDPSTVTPPPEILRPAYWGLP